METQTDRSPALFQETQKFRQLWVWGIVMLPMAIVLGILLYQLITGEPVGDRPAPNWLLLLILLLIPIPAAFGFFVARLVTRIDEGGLHYGWNIFGKRLNTIPWSEIRSLALIRYKFVGYGVHYARKYGTVHNVSGNVGLHVETKKGRKLTIGTTEPDRLDNVLRTIALRGVPYTDERDAAEKARTGGEFSSPESRSYT